MWVCISSCISWSGHKCRPGPYGCRCWKESPHDIPDGLLHPGDIAATIVAVPENYCP